MVGAQLGVDKSKLGKTCIAGPGRRSPGIFRLFATGELIGDKPLARSSHSIFPTCGGAGESGSTIGLFYRDLGARRAVALVVAPPTRTFEREE